MAVSKTRISKAGVVIHQSLAIPKQTEVLYEVRDIYGTPPYSRIFSARAADFPGRPVI